jgi:hypothetical protein
MPQLGASTRRKDAKEIKMSLSEDPKKEGGTIGPAPDDSQKGKSSGDPKPSPTVDMLHQALKQLPPSSTISRDHVFTLCALAMQTGTTEAERVALLDQVQKMSGVDWWTFRVSIGLLGAITLVALGTLLWFGLDKEGHGKDFSQGIIAIGSAAAGGLAGILVPRQK